MQCTQGALLRLDHLLLALSPLPSLLPATTKTQQAGVGRPTEAETTFPLPSWVGDRAWGEWVREGRVSACARELAVTMGLRMMGSRMSSYIASSPLVLVSSEYEGESML